MARKAEVQAGTNNENSPRLRINLNRLDVKSGSIVESGSILELEGLAYGILNYANENYGILMNRNDICKGVEGKNYTEGREKSYDIAFTKIRKTLRDNKTDHYIDTVIIRQNVRSTPEIYYYLRTNGERKKTEESVIHAKYPKGAARLKIRGEIVTNISAEGLVLFYRLLRGPSYPLSESELEELLKAEFPNNPKNPIENSMASLKATLERSVESSKRLYKTKRPGDDQNYYGLTSKKEKNDPKNTFTSTEIEAIIDNYFTPAEINAHYESNREIAERKKQLENIKTEEVRDSIVSQVAVVILSSLILDSKHPRYLALANTLAANFNFKFKELFPEAKFDELVALRCKLLVGNCSKPIDNPTRFELKTMEILSELKQKNGTVEAIYQQIDAFFKEDSEQIKMVYDVSLRERKKPCPDEFNDTPQNEKYAK